MSAEKSQGLQMGAACALSLLGTLIVVMGI